MKDDKDDVTIYVHGWPLGKNIRFKDEYDEVMGLKKPFSLKKELEEDNDNK
jgi:hypothetical protein